MSLTRKSIMQTLAFVISFYRNREPVCVLASLATVFFSNFNFSFYSCGESSSFSSFWIRPSNAASSVLNLLFFSAWSFYVRLASLRDGVWFSAELPQADEPAVLD